MTRKKTKLGDIVEIKTPKGLGYVQFTHEGGTRGELVRVLPRLYRDRPSDFRGIAQQKELYFVFLILNNGLRSGIGEMEVVSNEPIPDWAKSPPRMRHRATFDSQWKTTRWRIISAASNLTVDELKTAPLLTRLTPEQRALSIHEIWPPAVIVRKLAEGWTPEQDQE